VLSTNCQSGRVFGPNAFCSNSNEEQFAALQPAPAVPEIPVALRNGELLSRKKVPEEDVNWKETKLAAVKSNGELPSLSVSRPDAVPAHPRVHVPCQSKLLAKDAAGKAKAESRKSHRYPKNSVAHPPRPQSLIPSPRGG
jgi:hypothetical protein